MQRHNAQEVLYHYIVCALWSSCDEEDRPLDDYLDENDLSDECKDSMMDDVVNFLDLIADLETDEIDDGQIGHDFWLTRNGHGAGFWDRGLGDLGDKLTDAAHSFGSCYLYVGDDGRVYCE
jgi:hypothetical protein